MLIREIPLAAIIVPDSRMRRTFDEAKLQKLAASIRLTGLIHPITVEAVADGNFQLVAGERRLRAIQRLHAEPDAAFAGIHCAGTQLPLDHAPCFIRDELSELEYLEIEYAENADREDLPWQEASLAAAKLHAARLAANPSHTVGETAKEIHGEAGKGWRADQVAEKIVLAKHLEDPDVAKAKTQADAMKVVRKKAEAEHRAKLAAKFDLAKTPHSLIQGDLRLVMTTLTEGTYDVLITDPPYGVDADAFGSQADAAHTYTDSPEYFKELIGVIVKQATRVCKPAAHAYVFLDWQWFDYIKLEFELEGWQVWRRPFVWDKAGGMLPSPRFGPRQTYELILYAYRGDREVVQQAMPDVLRHPGVARPRRGAEKPVALYKDLLARSTRPGDKVLDCCAGTGPVLPAATQLRLVATAIENDETAYNIAVTRLLGEEKVDEAPDIII